MKIFIIRLNALLYHQMTLHSVCCCVHHAAGCIPEYNAVFDDIFLPPSTDSSGFGFVTLGGSSFADLAQTTDGFAFGGQGELLHFLKSFWQPTVLVTTSYFTTIYCFSFMKTPTSHGQTLERRYSGRAWALRQKTTTVRKAVMKRTLIMGTFTLSQSCHYQRYVKLSCHTVAFHFPH